MQLKTQRKQKNKKGLMVYCFRCSRLLTQPGALLFSSPDLNGQCEKIHLCLDCFSFIRNKVIDPFYNENIH